MITDIKKHAPHYHVVAPYKHQEEWLEKTWQWEAFAFLWEMGCGKSKPILDTLVRLFLGQEIDGALIVSDKGCYLGWIYDHIPSHMSPQVPRRIASWKSTMDKSEKAQMEGIIHAKDDVLDIFVMNIESFVSDRAVDAAAAFLMNHHAAMVIDESASIKNPRAVRTQKALMLGKLAEFRRIATGTPMTNSPLDLFSQFQFLKPGCLGFTSFTAFRAYYAEIITIPTAGGRHYPKIVGYRNLDQLTQSIADVSSRLLKEECVDLPEKIYETIYVEHTAEQREAYATLKTLAVAQFDQGLVTATDALKMLGKLHQINCGFIKDDDGVTHRIMSNRGLALIDQLEKLTGKVVIWGVFQEDMLMIMEAVSEKYGANSVVHYYGLTTPDERQDALRRFRDDSECRFMASTPAAGGKGLNDLVVASEMVYWSNGFNLMHRLQSEDRLHRPGQKRNVTIFDLVTPKTVDVKIVEALLDKKDLAHQVLDHFRVLLD